MNAKRSLLTGAAVLAAAALACDQPVGTDTGGNLVFQFSTASGVAFNVTQVAVTLRRDGANDINFTLQDQGDGTYSGSRSNIDVGTYTVVIRGLDLGEVEFFGQTSVTIVANQEASVAMTLNSFVPTLDAIAPTTSLDFTVSGTGVPDGESYLIEAARLPDFSSGVLTPTNQTQNGNNFSADFTAPQVGTYYVRVRAQRSGIDERGKPAQGIAALITGSLMYGDLIMSTIDSPAEVEVYSFDATAGTDGPMVVAFPTSTVAPPDMAMTVGPFGGVRFGGNKDAGVVGNNDLEWVVAYEPVTPEPNLDTRQAQLDALVVPPREHAKASKPGVPSRAALARGWQRLGAELSRRHAAPSAASAAMPPTVRTIEVTGALNTTGDFTLALDNCDAVAVTIGNPILTGLLSTDCIAINPLSADLSYGFYAYFTGTAGQDITINLSSGDFDATVFLFGPNGDLIAADDDGGLGTDSRIDITLPATGTYVVFPASYEDLAIGALDLGVNLSAPGVPTSLAFSIGPSNRAVGEAIPIEVSVLDASGSIVTDATNQVSLSFAVNPGRLLLRASGETGDDPKFQPLEPKAPAVYPDLAVPPLYEVLGMSYDQDQDAVLAVDWTDSLAAIDPVTGNQVVIGELTECCIRALGRALDGRLIGGGSPSVGDDQVYEVNPLTAEVTLIGTGSVTISGDLINGFHGLATDPTDGTFWGLANLNSTSQRTRHLVTIDLSASPAPVATHVATVSELGTADIAFFPDGTMYAITGQNPGATNPETLWTVDKSTGTMTKVFVLDDGLSGAGESIATIPAQLTGPLTVLSGSGVAVFNGVAINAPGTGYQLVATSPGLASAVSIVFDIN